VVAGRQIARCPEATPRCLVDWSGTASRPVRFSNSKKVPGMVSSKYYYRQSDLCLQLALLQADPEMTLLLVKLAKELRAKADDSDSAPATASSDLHDEFVTITRRRPNRLVPRSSR
jgi:hypothetical protein